MRSYTSSSLSPQNPTEIRVVSTTTIGFVDPRVDETVIWQGTDTDQLSREFPPSEIWGADPLGHKEIEDGWIRTDTRFERQLENGSWEEIDDPRCRLTPMTELEREIDAENRRLFPGDYITDDDCGRCGGYGCDECEDPYPEEPEYDCDYCRDFGCPSCEPESFCGECENSLSPGEGPLCKRCQDYIEQYADHPCRQCGLVSVAYDVDICDGCEHELYLRELDAEEAYQDTHCRYCEKELADGEDWICSGCEREDEESCKMWKEWWINPQSNRLARAFSWTRWVLHRIRRRINR